MDNIAQALYDSKFENAFLQAKGDAFQSFFNCLMERAYRGDFMPCRPWGNVGDKKNDGFLKSERRLFQCYAPNEMTEAKAREKINEDFLGAIPHWNSFFDKWTFVHNSTEGVPPHIHELILKLEQNNPNIKIDLWGLENLRSIFRNLEQPDLESWFGFVPSGVQTANFSFEDIKLVLEDIEAKIVPLDQAPLTVQPGKLKKNRLSEAVATLLRTGSLRAHLVKDFFESWYDETYGVRLQKSFHDKYDFLKRKVPILHPNTVFDELHRWAGGETRMSASRELALLAVLAYFFDSCDIFEPA